MAEREKRRGDTFTHWGLVVLALYGMVLVAFTLPTLLAAFADEVDLDNINFNDAIEAFLFWPYWVWLVVLLFCQGALLLVPVRVASRRPLTRRSLFWPCLATGFLVGCLVLGAALSIDEFFRRDMPGYEWFLWCYLALGASVWAFWTLVFFRRCRSRYGPAVVATQYRYLLRGSIAELLVAVPTHIVARHREYCCAGVMTFFGLATGISVLLASFGPGVFFLYLDRWRQLHPPSDPDGDEEQAPGRSKEPPPDAG